MKKPLLLNICSSYNNIQYDDERGRKKFKYAFILYYLPIIGIYAMRIERL